MLEICTTRHYVGRASIEKLVTFWYERLLKEEPNNYNNNDNNNNNNDQNSIQ